MPILGFRHKGLKRLWEKNDAASVDPRFADKIRRMLVLLNRARVRADLQGMPGWRFHEHIGDQRGVLSWTVSGNQRLLFRFEEGNAWDVDYDDPH